MSMEKSVNGELCAETRTLYKTAVEADDASKWLRFERWMSDRRFTPPDHLRIVEFPATGRGVMTTKFVHSGEILVSIPEGLLVTTDTVLMSDIIGCHMRTFCGPRRLSPVQALCAFIMCERLRCESSPFEAYLDMLPVAYTTPPYFPKHHLRHFNADVQERISDQKRKLKTDYEDLRPFLEHVAQFYGSSILDFRLFRWAWFSVNTRGVYWRRRSSNRFAHLLLNGEPDSHTLAPFLDFLNHSCDARVKAGFNEVTRTYDIVTLDDVVAYSQVFINYGPHDDVTLLLEYGFVLTHNPHSAVTFSASDIQDCCRRVLDDDGFARSISHICLQRSDLSCTWDGPTWDLVSTFKMIIQDVRHPGHERKEDTLERLLQSLITQRLEKVAQIQQRCSRSAHCLASTMSSILLQEERDILTKYLAVN